MGASLRPLVKVVYFMPPAIFEATHTDLLDIAWQAIRKVI
jgi:adenosylmethionine-8-amino-7-oxononanoate aminotransferase